MLESFSNYSGDGTNSSMDSIALNTTEMMLHTTTPYQRPFSDDAITASAVFILTMMVFGIFANSLTIAVISTSRTLWSIFNVLIVSLCVSDLLSALVSPLFLYRRTWGFDEWAISESFCKIFWAVDTWTSYVTSLHILIFAVTRLLSVQWPLQYKKIRRIHITILAVLVWVVTFLVACIPRWLWYDVSTKDRHADTVDAKWPACTLNVAWLEHYKIYYRIAFPLFIYVPMGMIALLSPTIAILLMRHRRRREALKKQSSPKNPKCRSKYEVKTRLREKYAIIQLAFIAGSFMFGYIPITAYTFYTTNVNQTTLQGKIYDWNFGMIAYIFLRLSECLNPIFYNVASAKMRRATRQFITRKLFKVCCNKIAATSSAGSGGSTSDPSSPAKRSRDLEL